MIDHIVDIAQIIFADIILSGDNALVIGMAAAGLSPELRKKAIFMGMALAAGLRIFFAAIASYLIAIPGILFFGGCLLAWVCWRFYGELRSHHSEKAEEALTAEGYQGSPRKQLWAAMVTITIADVSMSIDNVLAVAAIARDNTTMLVFGLVLAIAFMAFFATIIMKIMSKYPWLSYAGLVFLIFLTGSMLYDGYPEVAALIQNL
ncbi:MAG: TerC family protein [Cocleimonas sp.]